MPLVDWIIPKDLPRQLIQVCIALVVWHGLTRDDEEKLDLPPKIQTRLGKTLDIAPSLQEILVDAKNSAQKVWQETLDASTHWKGSDIVFASTQAPRLKNIQDIGDTPLLKLETLSKMIGRNIVVKCEFLNPGGSSKDRVAMAMIHDAGLKYGDKVYEGTVGSTGISLGLVCKELGLKLTICMPDDQSLEKYQTLESLGAKIVKVRPCSIVDKNHYVNTAARLAKKDGFFCNQFENLSNFRIHFSSTGPEILRDCQSEYSKVPDAFVMGAGTGGTLSGVSGFLKQLAPKCITVVADPQGSGLYNKVRHNVMYSSKEQEGSRTRHQVDTIVEGIGNNRMTKNVMVGLEHDWIDDAITVTDQQAILMSRYIYETEGLYLGSSSSVNLVAATLYALNMPENSLIVTVACDGGMRHVSKFWDDEVCREQFGVVIPEEMSLADVLGL